MLVTVWPGSLDAITWGGAIFLAWLGLSSLYRAVRHSDGGIQMPLDLHAASPRSHSGLYFGDGLAINLLSPVIISFYLSVVPTFIPAEASPFYYAGLAATHVSLALACHAMWTTTLDAMRRWLVAPWIRRALQAGSGLALMTLAARVLTAVLMLATVSEAQPADRVPVLAELFTSQGCNSCPPADDLLAKWIEEQPIDGVYVVALSEHVTYWDHQGWKDPFGSPQFTARQQQYGRRFNLDSIYTPQLVIDGDREFVGSDRRAIEGALRDAARRPKAPLTVTVTARAGVWTVAATGAGLDVEPDAELWFAITEDRLVIDVKRGENANRTLRHSGVVRMLRSAAKSAGAAALTVTLQPQWRRENLRVVAFVQSSRRQRVVAIGSARVSTP